jgi:hypothetical protein
MDQGQTRRASSHSTDSRMSTTVDQSRPNHLVEGGSSLTSQVVCFVVPVLVYRAFTRFFRCCRRQSFSIDFLTPILGHLLTSFRIDISPIGPLGSESGFLKGFNSIPSFLTAQGFLLGYWLRLCGVFNKRNNTRLYRFINAIKAIFSNLHAPSGVWSF